MITAIAIDDEPLALNLIRSLCDKNEIIHLQKTFSKPGEALKYLRKFPTDLIFCDIQMPGMTGINLARLLDSNIMVIFTTAFNEYAAASYELNAIDYLLKPLNKKRFDQAIEKVQEHFNNAGNNNQMSEGSIFIRADFKLYKILLEDIQYIHGLADYLQIYIKDQKTIVARMSMKSMLQKLHKGRFIRVHRSFILPFGSIDAIKGNTIYIGNQGFPIGKTYVEEILKHFPVAI